mgnify:CR=1 FL=1
MKKFTLNESIGDIYPIHIPNEVLNTGIFWQNAGFLNVNLGNLINKLKEKYGYVIDNFDNQAENASGVEMGKEFIENNYKYVFRNMPNSIFFTNRVK